MKSNVGMLFVCSVLVTVQKATEAVVLADNATSVRLETPSLPPPWEPLDLETQESNGTYVTRSKRRPIEPLTVSIIAASIAAGSLAATGAGVGAAAANPGCRDYGCEKGYCWAYCSIGNQWCYTTRSGTWKGSYVKCSRKEDCDGCWKCGGACTV